MGLFGRRADDDDDDETFGPSSGQERYRATSQGFKATRKLWGAQDKDKISNDDKLIERAAE